MAVQREIVDKDGNRLAVVQGGAGKAAVYGKTAAGEWVPLQVDDDGRAVLNVGEVSATIGVIEQGAAGEDPWPVKLTGSIVDTEDNVLRVKQYGTIMELYGATIDERPPANSVPVGATYMAVNTQDVWQSNGTDWVVM